MVDGKVWDFVAESSNLSSCTSTAFAFDVSVFASIKPKCRLFIKKTHLPIGDKAL